MKKYEKKMNEKRNIADTFVQNYSGLTYVSYPGMYHPLDSPRSVGSIQ